MFHIFFLINTRQPDNFPETVMEQLRINQIPPPTLIFVKNATDIIVGVLSRFGFIIDDMDVSICKQKLKDCILKQEYVTIFCLNYNEEMLHYATRVCKMYVLNTYNGDDVLSIIVLLANNYEMYKSRSLLYSMYNRLMDDDDEDERDIYFNVVDETYACAVGGFDKLSSMRRAEFLNYICDNSMRLKSCYKSESNLVKTFKNIFLDIRNKYYDDELLNKLEKDEDVCMYISKRDIRLLVSFVKGTDKGTGSPQIQDASTKSSRVVDCSRVMRLCKKVDLNLSLLRFKTVHVSIDYLVVEKASLNSIFHIDKVFAKDREINCKNMFIVGSSSGSGSVVGLSMYFGHQINPEDYDYYECSFLVNTCVL